ncbi:MAG TPA: nucleotide exchange factor GrpE [Burkholderiaceae bacterium]|nr:nucleotide exchange factor GrpE [Burkholderiaceae bacterium]
MTPTNEPLDPKQPEPSVDTSEQLEVNEQQVPDSNARGQDVDAGAPQEAEGNMNTEAQSDNQQVQAEEDWATMLAEAQEKVAQYHDQLLRARAEVENIRRRAQEDVSKARKFGTESFAESLIPVRDSLEAALALSDQTAQAWKEGVEATLRQLNGAFERNALKEVAPGMGDKFDPHLHQAISTVASEYPEGTVAQLLQKGYTISERVLRPALVMVSSGQSS